MPTNDSTRRNLSTLIREWEGELLRRGWHGSPYKLREVAWKKAQ